MDLKPSDFSDFFQGLWGVEPFPWQQRLVDQLAADSDRHRGAEKGVQVWPAVLDLPTGSGKTAAIDIAVFHLALEVGKDRQRQAPVRIAFVVDRRLIVDDAHARAEKLAEKLQRALDAPTTAKPVVHEVARRLRAIAGNGRPPLVARRLRGGAPLEEDWALTPVQPTVLCSTVDQVGSRLLFRGYGLSDRMKPLHAGLLGSDCLLLLDEAHLSEPFRQTLTAVARLRWPDNTPFDVALLTATPDVKDEGRFTLSSADRAHPTLAQRLNAAKPARLVEIANKQGMEADHRRAEEAVATAKSMLTTLTGSGVAYPAVAIVFNRVARAREAFERLARESEDVDIFLVIGPARAAEREGLAAALAPLRTGNDDARNAMKKPMVVVATQTVEAGVDLDFDGLVTEAAAYDALRQRFGRLNRAGRPISALAAILAHKADIGPKADDAVYGNRIDRTWVELRRLAGDTDTVDFGIEALSGRIDPMTLTAMATERQAAPVLMPAYAALWSQTSPLPNADPDVDLFLHGKDRSSASVQIVWRSDMAADDTLELVKERLTLLPPRAAEAVEVSLWAARRWLSEADQVQGALADVPEREPEEAGVSRISRRAFRWAGVDSDRTRAVRAAELQNGDLIVVPASYGGCDRWGWRPQSPWPVTDVADEAQWPFRSRRLAVRIVPELIVQGREIVAASRPSPGQPTDLEIVTERLATWLEKHASDDANTLLVATRALELPAAMQKYLDALATERKGLKVEFPYGFDAQRRPRGIVFIAPRGVRAENGDALAGLPSTESEETGSSAIGPVTLIDHSVDVRDWAGFFAASASLTRGVAEDVRLAAFLHDAGKADPRYQAYFAGGDPYGPDVDRVLAKSGQRKLVATAWKRARLPDGWRHEALSVRLAQLHPDFRKANDKALVLWLIGTHHGFGRPWFPHQDAEDGKPKRNLLQPFGFDDVLPPGLGPQSPAFEFEGRSWPDLFEDLKRRYGIWGLARLEAFVRLADHRASENAGSPLDAMTREAAE